MWFDSWSDIVRVLLVGAAAYAALVLVVRVFGQRTLAQLNAFDFVVTVALGSTLATILLNSTVSWAEGVVAFALLAAAQLVVALGTSRSRAVRDTVTTSPVVLVRDGRLLEDVMRRHRLSTDDVRAQVRAAGKGGLDQLAVVVLETDGKLSVVGTADVGDGWALDDLAGS